MAQDAFVAACQSGDLEEAKAELAKDGVHVNDKDTLGGTALIEACTKGRLHVVQWLVEDARADVNVRTRSGRTPFLVACCWNRLAIAKYLMSRGADARATNSVGVTPFWITCCGGHLEMAQWLAIHVGVGDDVTRPLAGGWSKGVTPLAIVKKWANKTMAQWLSSFLTRRVLIAYWSVGRIRFRSGLPALGHTPEAAAWHRLPREAMANVLLWLASP